MPWFKVDDALYSHPKWLATPAAARSLWVTAGSWCSAQLTDGFVPTGVLRLLQGRPKDAADLVRNGLWVEVEGGWQFHDWTEMQPSREAVMAERRSGAARQKVARSPELRTAVRERDQDRCRYCGIAVRWSDRRGPHGGTYDHVIPDGPTEMENLVVCCRACNSSKGRRTPEQAGMIRLDLGPRSNSDLDTARPPTRPDPTSTGCTSSAAATTSPDRRLLLENAAALIGHRAAQRPGTRDPAATAKAVARGVIADRYADAYAAIAARPTITAAELADHLEPVKPAVRSVLPPTHTDESIADLSPPPVQRIPDEQREAGLARVRELAAARRSSTPEDAA